ncbi:MAG: hypothetical protein MR019_09050 [Ruminococcus sp.]|nr:hypothetical protein [Ruminococcus sp.]MDY3895516.1 hypothetical protein [Candidatus Fimenecus sp.]
MKDYSYSELKEMQERAMERVRAMQQRASETVSRENSVQEETPKPHTAPEQNTYTKPHHIKMPANMPPRDGFRYENTEENRSTERNTDSRTQNSFSAAANENNIIESLLKEPDRAMLLPLLLLLKSEGSNEALLMSLLYIMS